MAISFGRRGSGGGEGSSRVGFVSNKQSSTHFEVGNHDTNFTNPSFTTTPSWQLTLKDGGKGEIVYSYQIILTSAASVTNARYSAKLQVAGKDSLSEVPENDDFVDVEILPENNHYIHDELITYDGETPIYYTLSGSIPFELSDLPSSITDNKYLRFRVPIKISADGSPTAEADNGFIAFKSFGVGAGSTDINGGDIRDGTITSNELANNSVTRPKINADAVDGTKIADNAIDNEHIATNAVRASQIQANAVTEGKISTGAVTENKIGTDAVTQSKIADGAIDTNRLADNSITPAKVAGVTASGNTDKVVAIDSGGGFKLVNQSSGGGGGITTVRPTNLEGITSTDTQQFIKTNFDASGFTHQSSMGPGDLNVGETGDRGKFVKVKSDGTGFETATGGGSLSSVDPSDLDGVTGGIGDASKFIKTDSTGDEFEAVSNIQPSDINGNIPASKLGLTGGGTDAGKFVKLDSAGTGFNVQGDITPDDLGVGEDSDQGRLVQVNSAGDGFISVAANSGGATVTLDNITGGPLPLNKGGTGYAADSLDALRQRLGVGSGAITDPELVRSTDADTQKDNTIHRFDSNTSNRPTGASNGIIARVGNDQWMLDVDDGQQWKREISNTGTGLWSTPVAATLTNLTTETDFRTLAEGGRGWTSSDTWLPSFSDGSKPAKVIVGRNGNYLVCIDRNNFFWAPRPAGNTWAEIPWRWEGTSTIPAGLYYTGGETDERLIPAGEDAVIGGKTNIPNENFVSLLVDHSVSGSTSTFTGYFVDDDSGQTIRSTTNTVGNTTGSWVRILVGSDGLAADSVNSAAIADEAVGADAIDNDIIVEDSGSSKAVFLGIVPSIDDLTFTGYTFKTSLTGFPEGGAYYDSSSRTMYVRHQPADIHLQGLFAIDYEVSIEKDASNYIRGVFDTISNFNLPGVGPLTGGVFRSADLDVTGTISNDDSVEIKGHKAVITKTDPIGTVNLANNAVTSTKIASGAVDTTQLADGAVETDKIGDNEVTAAKIAGVSLSGNASKVIAVNSGETALEMVDQSGGLTTIAPSNLTGVTGGATDQNKFLQINSNGTQFSPITSISGSNLTALSVDTSQIAADAIDGTKIEDNAVDSEHITADAIDPGHINVSGSAGGKVLGYNAAGTAFELKDAGGSDNDTDAYINRGMILTGNGGTTNNNGWWTFGPTVNYYTNEGRDNGVVKELLITDASDQAISITGNVTSITNIYSQQSGGEQHTGNITFSTRIQVRWRGQSESTPGSWTDANIINNTNIIDSGTLTGTAYFLISNKNLSLNFNASDLPSGISDGDLVEFRIGIQATANAGNTFEGMYVTYKCDVFTISGSLVGGGGGTPADGSITNSKLANDAVTIPDKIKSIYTQSASTYTVVATSTPASSLTAGQTHYLQGSGTGNLSIRFTSDDSDINANLTNGSVVTLWFANNKYRQLRITGNTAQGSSRVIVGTIVGGAGTITVGNTARILYDSTTAYDGVVKVGPDGKFTTGNVTVPSLGIAGAAADTGDILTIGTNGAIDATSGLILPSSLLTSVTKSEEYTVTTSNPTSAGQVAISDTVASIRPATGESINFATLANSSNTNSQRIMFVKDAHNYIGFIVTGNSVSGGNNVYTSVSNAITKGSLASGDKIRIFSQPANSGQVFRISTPGDEVISEDYSLYNSPKLIYVKQTTSISNPTNGTFASIVTTPGWLVPTGFKSGAHLEFSANGVIGFGSGVPEQIIPQVRIQHRAATTIAGLTSATWRETSNLNPGVNFLSSGVLFASKVSSGSNTSSDDRFRDYWAFASKPMAMSGLHADVVDGRYIQFEVSARNGATQNENISSIYGFDLTVRVWPGMLVTT